MRKFLILLLVVLSVACAQPAPAALQNSGAGSTQTQRDEQIRGNKRSMIYHWPGCPNYNDIAPGNRAYFKTRAEAEAAGYRAARNCN
jgi:hypothetical protein